MYLRDLIDQGNWKIGYISNLQMDSLLSEVEVIGLGETHPMHEVKGYIGPDDQKPDIKSDEYRAANAELIDTIYRQGKDLLLLEGEERNETVMVLDRGPTKFIQAQVEAKGWDIIHACAFYRLRADQCPYTSMGEFKAESKRLKQHTAALMTMKDEILTETPEAEEFFFKAQELKTRVAEFTRWYDQFLKYCAETQGWPKDPTEDYEIFDLRQISLVQATESSLIEYERVIFIAGWLHLLDPVRDADEVSETYRNFFTTRKVIFLQPTMEYRKTCLEMRMSAVASTSQ